VEEKMIQATITKEDVERALEEYKLGTFICLSCVMVQAVKREHGFKYVSIGATTATFDSKHYHLEKEACDVAALHSHEWKEAIGKVVSFSEMGESHD
jgi:hypothetical protein